MSHCYIELVSTGCPQVYIVMIIVIILAVSRLQSSCLITFSLLLRSTVVFLMLLEVWFSETECLGILLRLLQHVVQFRNCVILSNLKIRSSIHSAVNVQYEAIIKISPPFDCVTIHYRNTYQKLALNRTKLYSVQVSGKRNLFCSVQFTLSSSTKCSQRLSV